MSQNGAKFAALNNKMEIPPTITLPYIAPTNAPKGEDNCDQYSESFPRYFINTYTQKGEKILDPFLGFGTTALIAEELERIPYGIEADRARFEWAAGQCEHWQNIRHDDAINTHAHNFPKMAACITSPPFMKITDTWNPLYGGDPAHKGYDAYLARMNEIFTAIAPLLRKNAPLIIHADNIKSRRFTPLISDISHALRKAYTPIGETIIQWQNPPKNHPFTNALIFKKV